MHVAYFILHADRNVYCNIVWTISIEYKMCWVWIRLADISRRKVSQLKLQLVAQIYASEQNYMSLSSLHHKMFNLKFLPSHAHPNKTSYLFLFVVCVQHIHWINKLYLSHLIKWVYFGVHRFELEKIWYYYGYIILLETVQWLRLMFTYWCYLFVCCFFMWTTCD